MYLTREPGDRPHDVSYRDANALLQSLYGVIRARSDTSLLGATGSVQRFVEVPGRRTKKGATAAKRRYPDARA